MHLYRFQGVPWELQQLPGHWGKNERLLEESRAREVAAVGDGLELVEGHAAGVVGTEPAGVWCPSPTRAPAAPKTHRGHLCPCCRQGSARGRRAAEPNEPPWVNNCPANKKAAWKKKHIPLLSRVLLEIRAEDDARSLGSSAGCPGAAFQCANERKQPHNLSSGTGRELRA